MDKDNFIYITGRKKNVIITDNGKNIFPEEIEYELSKIPYIAESMVWGDTNTEEVNSTTVAATVLPDWEEVEAVLGKDYTDEALEKLIWDEVDKMNENLAFFKKVKKLVVRKRDFEKTTGKKIKRFVEDNKNA